MSSFIKYRVRDVAKDFDRTPKEIITILGKYGTAPKNNMQVLEDGELSVLFDYLTQHNQVESIESIFADTYHEPKPAPEAKPASAPQKAAEKAAPAPQNGGNKPAGNQQGGGKPAQGQQSAQKPAQGGQGQEAVSRKVPEKKIVDTRKSGNVNLEKYDQRLEDLAAGKTKQMQAGKQKFQGRNQQRKGGGFQGNKRRVRSRRRCAASRPRSPRSTPPWSRSPTRSPWASWPAA